MKTDPTDERIRRLGEAIRKARFDDCSETGECKCITPEEHDEKLALRDKAKREEQGDSSEQS